MSPKIIPYIVCAALLTAIILFCLQFRKTSVWYKYLVEADVMEHSLSNASDTVFVLKEECYFPFLIRTVEDIRRAERILTRRYKTKVVRIRAYKLTGAARFINT